MDFIFNALLGAAARRKLPYTRVAYLESTGTQYIDTGVAPDFAGGDEIEIKYTLAAFTGASPCVFGSRETGVKNGVYLLAGNGTAADNSGYSAFTAPTSGGITLKIDDASIVANGTTSTMPRRVTCGLPMFLFALNNYGTGTYGIYNGLQIAEWTYKQNGAVAQHLVPALDANNVPCFWDTVSNAPRYNAGTGTFNYGAAV